MFLYDNVYAIKLWNGLFFFYSQRMRLLLVLVFNSIGSNWMEFSFKKKSTRNLCYILHDDSRTCRLSKIAFFFFFKGIVGSQKPFVCVFWVRIGGEWRNSFGPIQLAMGAEEKRVLCFLLLFSLCNKIRLLNKYKSVSAHHINCMLYVFIVIEWIGICSRIILLVN